MPFTFARSYSLDKTQEFDPGIDTFFGDTYSIPDLLEDLEADQLRSNVNLYVKGPLFDQFDDKGGLGQVLLTDANGVFWGDVSGIGTPLQSIAVFDEGGFIATVSTLNFLDGTDPTNLIQVTQGISSSVANITVSDRWSLSGGDIYRNSKVGINNSSPAYDLDVTGTVNITSTLNADGSVTFNSTLDVDGATILNSTLEVTDQTTLDGFVQINNDVIITGFTTGTISTSILSRTSEFSEVSTASTFIKTVETTTNQEYYIPFVENSTSTDEETIRVDSGIKYNPSDDSLTIDGDLLVDQNAKVVGTLELDNALIDINGNTAVGKTDYRLASVGTGVSWRPPGVETQNAIWVTVDGNDSNSGYLEGDAKRTIGSAASIAKSGDTIFVRSGVYYENNPIGLRTDVSVSGQDLRLVTVVPTNVTKDVFHVRRGCLIENLNFAGTSVSVAHTGCGAVAFPPTNPSDYANSGYIAAGPTLEGPTGRWRSPYVRNCTNFMSGSIGMKINGDHASVADPINNIGNNLKSMVCDSFTQYNENGIGVSITNNGYAQLVSIFTINCDKGIYVDSGGSCDLTNSNSSFGNFGLYAVGLGATEYTGEVLADTIADNDVIVLNSVYDSNLSPRRPYDGQALWFKINLDNYPDAVGTGTITSPLEQLDRIVVTNGGSGYSEANPPSVLIVDLNDGSQLPKGPQGIIAEASPTVDPTTGQITEIDVVNSGRNYLSSQNISVVIEGNATATAIMSPIYFTVSEATEPSSSGVTTVTFNEFIPYELFANDEVELKRISRILTSSHSFEYIGSGTDINTSIPLQGAVPIKANEVVALDGAQIPFTSTDQKGNFDIGDGIQIDQTTSTIRGRDFSRAIQAEVTPLILALR